jgi:hypothetical protein
MHRNRVLALLGLVAVTGLAVGSSSWAHAAPNAADVGDTMLPANSFVTLKSTHSSFTVPPGGTGLTVTCTNNLAVAKTPPKSTTSGTTQSLQVLPPTFDNGINTTTFAVNPCTDNLHGTEVTTTSGAWTASATDLATETTEPNTDSVTIVIPKGGAVVKSSLGCTITVAPSAPFAVKASYVDSTGQLIVNIKNLPILITGSGCPPATLSDFVATYTTTPRLHDN